MTDIMQLVLSWYTFAALTATLVFVVKYTFQTKRLAESTEREYKKRISPVVCAFLDIPEEYKNGWPIGTGSEDGYKILVSVPNTSDNHALAKVKIEFEYEDKTFEPQADVYSGLEEIFAPAGATFDGNFSFDDMFRELPKNEKKALDDLIEKKGKSNRSDNAFEFYLRLSDSKPHLDWRTGINLAKLLLSDSGLKIYLDVEYRRWPTTVGDEIHRLPRQMYTMRINSDIRDDWWRLTCIPQGTVLS